MGCWDGKNSQKYTGSVSWTKNGRACQSWTAQEPQKHRFKTDDFFPLDGSVADAENSCRDPDNEGTPWCYTTIEDIRWEFCEIPVCKYAGTQTATKHLGVIRTLRLYAGNFVIYQSVSMPGPRQWRVTLVLYEQWGHTLVILWYTSLSGIQTVT